MGYVERVGPGAEDRLVSRVADPYLAGFAALGGGQATPSVISPGIYFRAPSLTLLDPLRRRFRRTAKPRSLRSSHPTRKMVRELARNV